MEGLRFQELLIIIALGSLAHACLTNWNSEATSSSPESVGIESSSNWRSYRTSVYKNIRQHFTLPTKLVGKDLAARVLCRIDETGKISSMRLEKSSGNAEFDQIVLDAVKQSQPFPKPPSDVVGKDITFNFNAI